MPLIKMDSLEQRYYESLTVKQLKQECKIRGLKNYSNIPKAQMIFMLL